MKDKDHFFLQMICQTWIFATDKVRYEKHPERLSFASGIDPRYISCSGNTLKITVGGFGGIFKDPKVYLSRPPQPFTFPETRIKDPTAKIMIGKCDRTGRLAEKLCKLDWPKPYPDFQLQTGVIPCIAELNAIKLFDRIDSSFYYLYMKFDTHEEELYSDVDGIWYFVTNQQLIKKKSYHNGVCSINYDNGLTFTKKMPIGQFLDLNEE